LCEFIRLIINNEEQGLFFPQNKEYVRTSELVREIAEVHDSKIWMTKLFNPMIKMLSSIGVVNKVFGNLVYKKRISEYKEDYRVNDLKTSIKKTEV
jgi:UDP-glucose 4-epimerase